MRQSHAVASRSPAPRFEAVPCYSATPHSALQTRILTLTSLSTILLTAFEPYGRWTTNASYLALIELSRDLPSSPQITTRVLPVDYDVVKGRLAEDLSADYDYVLHLGQAPGSARIQLEAIGLNVACEEAAGIDQRLCDDGPLAYRSTLPLFEWAEKIRAAGIPAEVSFHAGTYLCNAALYLTHYYIERMRLKTQAVFIHLPLDPTQVPAEKENMPSVSAGVSAKAIRTLLETLG
jgi:pyroglutamyl-peptidase